MKKIHILLNIIIAVSIVLTANGKTSIEANKPKPVKETSISGNQPELIQTFYFDFGFNNTRDGNTTSNPDKNAHYWNNITNYEIATSSLINSNNEAMGYQLYIVNNFAVGGINQGGLLKPSINRQSDLTIVSATKDYSFVDGKEGASKRIKLRNLNPDRQYKFYLFSSREVTENEVTTDSFVGKDSTAINLQTAAAKITFGDINQNNNQVASSSLVMVR